MKHFLHVGCGSQHKDKTTPGFNQDHWQETRLDIDPGARPDIIGSMTDMPAVATDSMDALYSSHNIEHLYAHEVPLALKEFHRVLKADGYVVINCPDLQSVCRYVADNRLLEPLYVSEAGPIAAIDILYGLRPALAAGKHYMAHRCGFTRDSLSAALGQAGFITVVALARPAHVDLWAIASKANLDDQAVMALMQEHGLVEARPPAA